jgi:predicted phage terminase large subunit-like protein
MQRDIKFLDAVARESLFYFTWRSFNVLHPGSSEGFVPNWHVRAMCHALEEVRCGRIQRLIITVPPRHLKSICTSVAFTAWMLGHDPSIKILNASYGIDLARKHWSDTRTLMQHPFYRNAFPKTRLTIDRDLELVTSRFGMRKAVSLGGAVTGLGADIVVIDDIMKAGDANSDIERQRVIDYYTGTLYSRLNNKKTGRIVIIQQRLTENDLVGYLMEKRTFHVLNLPAIAPQDEIIPTGHGRVHQRKKNDILFPQRESRETLEATRREMGNTAFNAQYLQNPINPGGNYLKMSWFGTYKTLPERNSLQYVAASWDTAMSAEPTSDFSVCSIWGYQHPHWYLLEVHRARYDFYELVARAMHLNGEWDPDTTIIEDAASGKPLLQLLRKSDKVRKLFAIRPIADKIIRMQAQTVKLESGKFLLPEKANWLPEFTREYEAFPVGKYKDQIDSLSQFLYWTSLGKSDFSIKSKGRPAIMSSRIYGRLKQYS